jgi:hypothetical protein
LRKTKIDDVTPAKAGVQSEKLDSRFRGNDKYCFRNMNYLPKYDRQVFDSEVTEDAPDIKGSQLQITICNPGRINLKFEI